jgi:hypothetical protein
MNVIDRWWNDTFPPYSMKRLAFFWAVTPIMSVLAGIYQGLASGEVFSAPAYWIATLGGLFTITLGFVLARSRRNTYEVRAADDRDDTESWSETEPGNYGSTGPRPMAIPSGLRFAGPAPVTDFVLSAAITFVGMTIVTTMMGTALFDGRQLLVNLGAGLGAALVIRFRHSPLTYLIVAMLAAVPVAGLAHLFFYFLGGEDSFWTLWAIIALFLFVSLLPMWYRMRASRDRIGRYHIPAFAIALAGNFMMVIAVAFTAPWESSTPTSAAGTERPPIEAPAEIARPAVIASSPTAAAQTLFDAWTFNDVDKASGVAASHVVAELFRTRQPIASRFAGCDPVSEMTTCTYTTPDENIVVTVAPSGGGTYAVQSLERTAAG